MEASPPSGLTNTFGMAGSVNLTRGRDYDLVGGWKPPVYNWEINDHLFFRVPGVSSVALPSLHPL